MGAEDGAGGGGARGAVTVRLPPGQRAGAVLLEVVRGGFVSNMRPLLVLDSAAAVADMARLEAARPAGARPAGVQPSWGEALLGCSLGLGFCSVHGGFLRRAHAPGLARARAPPREACGACAAD